jgi:multiple sugar transport system ATP-binding protein
MSHVHLRGIEKRYGGTEVIRGVNLDIADGEFVVFVGPSGCGKSSMLRMIAGLEEISGGELFIGARRANDLPPAERGAAMVFQNYALYPHMTVAQNMGFALKIAGQGKNEVTAAVQRAAKILRIEHLLERKPKALSGGERQRVAIGRAIVRKPQVFLFDEPLSNLDASLRVQMRLELSRLHRELGSTMIYVTHDQVEAMTMGQRIVVFNGGKIEQVGTPLELYNHPVNQFVAGFLGSPRMNFIPCRALGWLPQHRLADSGELSAPMLQLQFYGAAQLALPLHVAQDLIGSELTLGVRPEHLQLCEPGAGLAATVDVCEHLGDALVLYLALPGMQEPVALRLEGQSRQFVPGEVVGIAPRSGHGILFDGAGRAL